MAHPLSRTDIRLGLGALALAGLIGAGAFMLGGSETASSFGRGLAIAVVHAVEPEVLPGETMEVGALRDGFDRAALERVADLPLDETLPPPAWVGDASLGDPTPRMPMPTPVGPSRIVEVAGPSPDPLSDGSRAFGFDQPRPDYAGERALRWSRIETAAPQSEDVTSSNDGAESPQYSPE